MQRTVLDILTKLNDEPTATFHEHLIERIIHEITEGLQKDPEVAVFRDVYGNLRLRYSPAQPTHEIVLVAHTDHPAFEIVGIVGNHLRLEVLGGVPLAEAPGCPVRWEAEYGTETGVIVEIEENKKHVRVEPTNPVLHDWVGLPAVHDLPEVSIEGPVIFAPVIDDFVGVSMALAALHDCVRWRPKKTAVTVLLTRAEEIGFIGAQGAILERTVNEDAIIISLEASSVLPNVSAGDGPVIRQGDRGYWFDKNVQDILEKAAENLRNKGKQVQSARMTGGVCEASLFHCFGYAAGGLAIPLLNYHNKGKGKIEREGVHTEDVETGVALLVETVRVLEDAEYRSRGHLRHRIMKRFLDAEERLRGTANRKTRS
jgi:endoglucanase